MNTEVLIEHAVDAIALIAVIALITGYHWHLRRLIRANPAAVLSSVAAHYAHQVGGNHHVGP